MCGITGGISFTGQFFLNREELLQAARFLRYRGPDDEGDIFVDGSIAKLAFAHRRLSVIDLSSSGRQPMRSASGRTCIVFNGEIYNYEELRRELERKQFVFHSRSDTEVILNAYECWGIEKTLQKLDGMFALALFDFKDNTIFLARDLFGKKPLYFYNTTQELFFSSDIRSFGVVEKISLTIDLHALGYLFSELSTPYENTIWTNVRKLRPGCFVAFNSDGVVSYKPFQELTYTESCTLSRREIIAITEKLIVEAVDKRLVGDVNVAALLSGGIDSSLVVANMARRSGRVRTYSAGFYEGKFNELSYARHVAKTYDTDHTEILIQPDDVDDIYNLIAEFGEPFADASMLPSYWIAKEVAKTEKVVLGGDGGDELFGGYDSYYFAHKYDKFKKFKFLLSSARLLYNGYPSYRTALLLRLLEQTRAPDYHLLNRNMGFDAFGLKKLFGHDLFYDSLDHEHSRIWELFAAKSNSDVIKVMSASLKTRLVSDYLVKVDRSTMYASIEMRSPLLDKNLAELAVTLKPTQLFYRDQPKSILKEIAKKHFGVDFVNRNKMGFSTPIGQWLKEQLAEEMKSVILGGRQKLVDLNYPFIERLINDHCNGLEDHSNKLWALLVFHIWANNQ